MYLRSLCFFAASFSIARSATERAIVTVHSSIQGKPCSATSSWTSFNIFCPLDEDARIHRRIEHKKNRAAVATSPIAKEEPSPSQRPIGHRFGSLGDECSICLPFTIEQIPKKKTCKTNAMDSRRGPFPICLKARITCMIIPASIRKAKEVLSRKTETSMLLCNDASKYGLTRLL